MTEPKFTPGPYCVEVEDLRGGRFFSVCTKYDYIIDGLHESDNGNANAHLFATAPELYAELARIDPTNPVLAKARGETSR